MTFSIQTLFCQPLILCPEPGRTLRAAHCGAAGRGTLRRWDWGTPRRWDRGSGEPLACLAVSP